MSRNGRFSKSKLGNSYSLRFSTNRKLAVNSILLLLFHDVVSAAREQHAQQPLTRVAVSVRVFGAVAHSRVYRKISFCIVFSKNFNIISTLFIHQSLALPQKIDSRESLFRYKKGLACARSKMNIYLKKASFTPLLGLFAAKSGAFWCKMTCVLVQNAARFGTKCKVFWC